MISYHGKADLKRDFLAQITWHEEQDALVKGTYARMNGHFKGCAIGCSIHSLNLLQGKIGVDAATGTSNHQRLVTDLGWPLWLAYLEDHLFECLPDDLSRTWPRRLAEAIPAGVEITYRVLARILWWGLAADTYGARYATDDAKVRGWIDTIAAMLAAEGDGTCTPTQREAAALAAREAWPAPAAREEWAAREKRTAWAAWEARAAWEAWAARETREAWPAWEARAALEAREAAARAAKSAKIIDGFYPALSEFVLAELRALTPTATP